MAYWTNSTKRQRGRVTATEAKSDGRVALRHSDRAAIAEGLDELDE